MDITFTALAVLAASLLGGYGLRTLIHSAGRRWLHLGADTAAVMGGIAFWGMLVGGLVMAVRMLAAPAVGDALATLAVHGPAFLAAVAVVVVGHLLGVVGQDLIGRSARVVSTGSEQLVRRTTYAVVLFLSIVMALDLVGVYVGWILNTLVGVVIALFASVGIALSIGSIGFVQDLMTMRRFPELIRPGARIRVGNIRGRVIEVTETTIIVESAEGIIHVPGRYLATRPLLVEPDKTS
jgi:Mechanosensitive ion channel